MHSNKHSRSTLVLAGLPLLVAALAVCAPPAGSGSANGKTRATLADGGQSGSDESPSAGDTEEEAGNRTTEPGGGCIADSAPFDEAKMRAHLGYLASPELAGRAPGTPGDLAARKYIADRFRCLGVLPGGDGGTSYFQSFVDSQGTKSVNVVGMIPGTDPAVGADIIVLSSHLDHFGTIGGEGLRLGANDNASGITSVLTIAQAVKQQAKAPRRTLAFMVFGSEELGCDGSHVYVDNSLPALPMNRVVYDINFDMVGTYSQNGSKVVAHGTLAKTPATPLINALISAGTGLNVEVGAKGLGEDDSDYYPFCAAGVPMVGFFTDDPECYHEACDTAERIDYTNLSRIAKLGGELAIRLADSATDLAAFRKQAQVKDLGCGED